MKALIKWSLSWQPRGLYSNGGNGCWPRFYRMSRSLEVVVESPFFWQVRTSFKNILLNILYNKYIHVYHISIITVNLPKIFSSHLVSWKPNYGCTVSSFVGLWGAKADCRATEVSTHGSVGCQGNPVDRGRLFGQTFWKGQGSLGHQIGPIMEGSNLM